LVRTAHPTWWRGVENWGGWGCVLGKEVRLGRPSCRFATRTFFKRPGYPFVEEGERFGAHGAPYPPSPRLWRTSIVARCREVGGDGNMHGRPGFDKTTPGRPSCRCATRPFFKRPGYPVFLRLESDLVRNERTLSAFAKAMADKHSGEVPRVGSCGVVWGKEIRFGCPSCGLRRPDNKLSGLPGRRMKKKIDCRVACGSSNDKMGRKLELGDQRTRLRQGYGRQAGGG
jgi:hypothetical protein